jgi:hypothetical protein
MIELQPYVEWLVEGEGHRLIGQFLKDSTLQNFKEIYYDLQDRIRKDRMYKDYSFIPKEHTKLMNAAASRIIWDIMIGQVKPKFNERYAAVSIAKLGQVAAIISKDEKWSPPQISKEHPLQDCAEWFSHLKKLTVQPLKD